MTRFADPHACPDCGTAIQPGIDRCPGCALSLRGPVAQDLYATLLRADELLAQLRASTGTTHPTTPAAPTAADLPSYPRATAPTPEPGRGLRARAIPRVLLGLGALCLLIAGSVFLWVTWELLGVHGRTVVVTAITAGTAAATFALVRRGLRTAAESLTTVTLGFGALTMVGFHHSGWLGGLDVPGAVAVTGVVLGAAGWAAAELAHRSPVARLLAAEIGAGLAVGLASLGLLASNDQHPEPTLVLVVAAGIGLVLLARTRRLPILGTLVALGTVVWWLVLLGFAIVRAGGHASFGELWLGLEVWPLVAAGGLVAVLVPMRSLDRMVRLGGAAIAGSVAAVTIAMPAVDESSNVLTATSLGLLVLTTLVLRVTPRGWGAAAACPVLLAATVPLVVLGSLATLAAAALVPSELWSLASFDPLTEREHSVSPLFTVPLLLGLLLVAVVVHRRRPAGPEPRVAASSYAVPALLLLAAAVVVTLVLLGVPLLVVVLVLLAVAALVLGRAMATDSEPWLAVAGGVLAVALVAGLANSATTAVVLVAVVGLTGWLAVSEDRAATSLTAHAVLPAALAGLVWTAAELGGLDHGQRAYPILLLLGVLAIARPVVVGEISAAIAATVASAAAIAQATDPQLALAIHLTAAGALVTITSLVNAERRLLGWAGGVLLMLATWVRLEQVGVSEPEPYTLPAAVALLVVGLLHLRRHADASTATALTPGLVLATVPSLLWCLADPLSWRALALGAACVVLVIGGAVLRWSAPLVVGAAVLAVLAVRAGSPWLGSINPWITFGVAGILLTTLGVTWESRMNDVRRSAAYLRRLR